MWRYLKSLVARMFMRFFPSPPKPSYDLVSMGSSFGAAAARHSISLKGASEWHICRRQPEAFEAFLADMPNGQKIACVMIKPCKNPKFTILYNHGGTVDIGQVASSYYTIGERLNCNIFTYDYSGFGASSGEYSEENLYTNAKTAWNVLVEKYELEDKNIILYGQSLGAALAIYLAAKHQVAGVIIHSAFMSILRVAFPRTPVTPFFDSFPNIDKIGKIDSPVLVIHGTNDYVVPIAHGRELHKRCRRPVTPLWVTGAGHDDVYQHSEYLERLKRFVDFDMRYVAS